MCFFFRSCRTAKIAGAILVSYSRFPVTLFSTPLRGVLFNTPSESVAYLRGSLFSTRQASTEKKECKQNDKEVQLYDHFLFGLFDIENFFP